MRRDPSSPKGSPKGYSLSNFHRWTDLDQLTNLQRIRVPSLLRLITWMFGTGMVVVAALLTYVPWVQTTTGMGLVTTLDPQDRVQSINAMVPGFIAEWYVNDGDLVAEGDPIVLIQDVDTNLVSRLQSQLEAAQRKYAAAREAVATAQIDYQRKLQLFEEGLASRYEYEQARIKVQELRVAEEEALAGLNDEEVNLSRQGSQLVRAPRDGTILHVEAGSTSTIVTSGQALATFLPADVDRAVEIYIEGRDIGLVYPGRRVRLQFEGWPAFQFSGMPEFAIGTFPGEVVYVEPRARDDGRFRVVVQETLDTEDCLRPVGLDLMAARDCGWPPESFVRLGAKAQGWILLDTVSLGFELWRQLNNFPPENRRQAVQASEGAP